jgi:hypothetical protein
VVAVGANVSAVRRLRFLALGHRTAKGPAVAPVEAEPVSDPEPSAQQVVVAPHAP